MSEDPGAVPAVPSAADVQAAFCAVLCDEWARAGITDAVVAPGSRSTPMVAALDAEARIRVTVVLDERSAGFTALGMGLATGRPAVVVTTSGTASVELHPAVVEAGQAGVPLIAVTTDRPPELHRVGAPQTVEQHGLFGPVVRWSFDPGVADAAGSAAWRSLAARCVAEATASPDGPGPVHLNLPFREPLLGRAEGFPAPAGRADGGPWHRAEVAGGRHVPAEVVELIAAHAGRPGLIVAGHGAAGDGVAAAALLGMAARLGWPVLADPRSRLRTGEEPDEAVVVAAADALLRHPAFASQRPEIVVRVGSPWASKVLGQWLAALPADRPQVLVDRWGRWADPDRRATHVVAAEPQDLATAVVGRLDRSGAGRSGAGRPGGASKWPERWRSSEVAAREVFDKLLGAGGDLELSEPAVARACLDAVPEGGSLVVSSSMPVRDVEWFGRPRAGVAVLSNRGANGIDGVVSTAMGAAIGTGRPVVTLIGDLAFLYDVSALLWAPSRPASLSVVVIDNDGGGIFSFLPQASALPPERFERYWGTPHGVDPVALAAAYGVAAARIDDRAGLDRFLARAGEPGVRVGVVASRRDTNVADHDLLNAAVQAAVGA